MAGVVTGIFSFSLLIYPHIPVQKAGGDFTKAPRICIRLNSRTQFRDCPPSLLPKRTPDQAFIELDEDDHFLYVANDQDHGGPSAWVWALARSASQTNCESNDGLKKSGETTPFCRPEVFAVSKECISGLKHFDPEDFSPSDKSDRCEAFEEDHQSEPPQSRSSFLF